MQIIGEEATVLHNASSSTATWQYSAQTEYSFPEANPTARGMMMTARELGNLIE